MKLDAKNFEGDTPLHAAAAAGKFEMVRRTRKTGGGGEEEWRRGGVEKIQE